MIDRENLIKDMRDFGIGKIINVGADMQSSLNSINLAKKYDFFYAAVGVHPYDTKEMCTEDIKLLQKYCECYKVVAIGETGLDYHYEEADREEQCYWFKKQLELAKELKMPVFLHDRESYNDFAKILRQYPTVAKKSVVHCFTGNRYEVEDYIELGCYIGVTGWICDERRGDELREAVRYIPPERLMIETDGPFLIPRDLKPKPKKNRNEPKYLPHILDRIANEMGLDSQELGEQVTENTLNFFNL